MRRIIITGGAGFIGSHLLLGWIKKHPNVEVMNVDKLGLEECRQYWQSIGRLEKARFHHVSTDEVYGASPACTFEESLQQTVKWYAEKYQ